MTQSTSRAAATEKSVSGDVEAPILWGAAPGAAATRTSKRRAATLADQAYALIKHRIVTLHYKPGALLNERNISADLGIGRMPVHMAISRLALEDLIEVVPRHGLRVKPLILDDIRAVFEARMLNEPPAAALAALRATDEDIRSLRDIVKKSRATNRRNRDELLRIDQTFHHAIAAAAHNRVLMQLLHALHDRSLRQWFISWNYPSSHSGDSASDHKAVVDAIQKRDPTGASRAMREHLESASEGFQLLFGQLEGFSRI